MMQNMNILAVKGDIPEGNFVVTMMADVEGSREEVTYSLTPGASLGVANEVRDLVQQWLSAGQYVAPLNTTITTGMVNHERDKRLRSGFPLEIRGQIHSFDSDDASVKRITGAAALAGFAIAAGATSGDYTWAGPGSFSWITQANEVIPVDAFEMMELGKAAAAWEQANVFAARDLKVQDPIPSDFTNDAYWP